VRTALEPFQFFTVAHVSRSGHLLARTVRELLYGLERCSDESIYHHMVESMGSEEFLNNSAANDFAKWVKSSLHCGGLPELLESLDERYYTSISEMRADLCAVVRDYIAAYPECGEESAPAPFRFCEGLELTVPLNRSARNLEELRDSIQNVNVESFYLHFVASSSRLEAQTNDYSNWLQECLGLNELASRLNQIDLTDTTLLAAREKVVQLLDEETRTLK
jgi:hypothetical protein